jgi:hypothetical protein
MQSNDTIDLCALAADRTIRAQLAVRFNVLLLLYVAKQQGQQPTFWTFTYKELGEHEEMAADWSTFLRRLRKKLPKLAGVRVFELGRKKGRFHVHAVFDRFVDGYLIQDLKKGTRLGYAKPKFVGDDNLARYFYKELVKQIHQRGLRGRRWACFGKLPNQPWVTASSLDLGLPWKIHQRNAFLTRPVGESRRETMLYGFKDWINREIEPGLAVVKDGQLLVTDVYAAWPDPPTRAVRGNVTVELIPVDKELLACMENPDVDEDTEAILAYRIPNPRRRADAIALPDRRKQPDSKKMHDKNPKEGE